MVFQRRVLHAGCGLGYPKTPHPLASALPTPLVNSYCKYIHARSRRFVLVKIAGCSITHPHALPTVPASLLGPGPPRSWSQRLLHCFYLKQGRIALALFVHDNGCVPTKWKATLGYNKEHQKLSTPACTNPPKLPSPFGVGAVASQGYPQEESIVRKAHQLGLPTIPFPIPLSPRDNL